MSKIRKFTFMLLDDHIEWLPDTMPAGAQVPLRETMPARCSMLNSIGQCCHQLTHEMRAPTWPATLSRTFPVLDLLRMEPCTTRLGVHGLVLAPHAKNIRSVGGSMVSSMVRMKCSEGWLPLIRHTTIRTTLEVTLALTST